MKHRILLYLKGNASLWSIVQISAVQSDTLQMLEFQPDKKQHNVLPEKKMHK